MFTPAFVGRVTRLSRVLVAAGRSEPLLDAARVAATAGSAVGHRLAMVALEATRAATTWAPRHVLLYGAPGAGKRTALLVAAALGGVGGARAVPIDLNDGAITGSVDSTLTFGFGVRAKNPSCGLTGDPSSAGCGASANTNAWSAGDDGNLNYHKGDVFTAYGKGTHEVLLKAPEYGLAFMGRFSYLVDPAATHTQRTELGSAMGDGIAWDYVVEITEPTELQGSVGSSSSVPVCDLALTLSSYGRTGPRASTAGLDTPVVTAMNVQLERVRYVVPGVPCTR